MKPITSMTLYVILLCLPALAQQETIEPEILRQLQMLDGGYRSRWYHEAMLYRTSFQQTLKEIETALGEQRCYSEQLLVSQLMTEFDVEDTPIERILEMNADVGTVIASCWGK